MAKKRDRRVSASPGSRRDRIEPLNQLDRSVTSLRANSNKDRKSFTVFVIFFIVSTSIALILYFTHRDSSAGTSMLSHNQESLVKTELSYPEVLAGNSKVSENASHRNFANPVLAYVTPWNSKGYDMAKRFYSKFTHISPVWYDLKSQGTKIILEGRHNADRGWILELRRKGNAKILPRVVVETFPDQLLKKKQKSKAIDLLVAECKEMAYDGIVLESWSRWAAFGVLHDPGIRKMALNFIKQLGQSLHDVSFEGTNLPHLELVYVIGPPHGEQLQQLDFGPEDFKYLGDAVDGFSLMTYDFSSPQHPGPNAPLGWVHSTLQRLLGTSSNDAGSPANKKVYVGINFYGNDFTLSEGRGGGALIGRDYLSILEQYRPLLQWEKESAEHFFIYYDNQNIKHAVFYPSPMSVSLRLEEARSWGAGISIWELGQGLDYFVDLL